MDKAQERDEQAQQTLRGWAEDFVATRLWLRLDEETKAVLAGHLYSELRSAYIKGTADEAANVADAFREGR